MASRKARILFLCKTYVIPRPISSEAQMSVFTMLDIATRLGFDAQTSVVDSDCRSRDIPNLWVCDGSVFPTTGGVNPSLTITAIAMRAADRIKALAARGEL